MTEYLEDTVIIGRKGGHVGVDDDGLWIYADCHGCAVIIDDVDTLNKLRNAIGVYLIQTNRENRQEADRG